MFKVIYDRIRTNIADLFEAKTTHGVEFTAESFQVSCRQVTRPGVTDTNKLVLDIDEPITDKKVSHSCIFGDAPDRTIHCVTFGNVIMRSGIVYDELSIELDMGAGLPVEFEGYTNAGGCLLASYQNTRFELRIEYIKPASNGLETWLDEAGKLSLIKLPVMLEEYHGYIPWYIEECNTNQPPVLINAGICKQVNYKRITTLTGKDSPTIYHDNLYARIFEIKGFDFMSVNLLNCVCVGTKPGARNEASFLWPAESSRIKALENYVINGNTEVLSPVKFSYALNIGECSNVRTLYIGFYIPIGYDLKKDVK